MVFTFEALYDPRTASPLLSAMTAHNWMLMGVWTAVGFLIYFLYGYRHSRLRTPR